MVRFYWCHSEGCPNYGRARQRVPNDTNCHSCARPMSMAAPEDEKPIIIHERKQT